MKLELDKFTLDYLLAFMRKPRKVMGALVVTIDELKNNYGDIIPAHEICQITQSFRGYGIQTIDVQEDGRKHEIHRVKHSCVRFFRPELTVEDLKKLAAL